MGPQRMRQGISSICCTACGTSLTVHLRFDQQLLSLLQNSRYLAMLTDCCLPNSFVSRMLSLHGRNLLNHGTA